MFNYQFNGQILHPAQCAGMVQLEIIGSVEMQRDAKIKYYS